MLFSSLSRLSVLAGLVAIANAHFQLQFPAPRGPFVEDNEPRFCDGYTNVTTNRTQFPMSGGYIALNSEHPKWTATVLVATSQDPTSFGDFKQSIPFFQVNGEGQFCIPFNLSSTNVTGLSAGQNLTLQFEFDGGDGALFQCADITLANTVSLASCSNGTGVSTASGSSSATASSSASGTSQTSRNDAVALSPKVWATIVLALTLLSIL